MGVCASMPMELATESTNRTGMTEMVPPWVYRTVPIPGCEQDSLNSYSDGFQVVDQYSVIRHRMGNFHTDAARWSRGFTSGKHVFEILYPESSRGVLAGIGVGTQEAPLFTPGKLPLIGQNKFSWGIDLRRKKSFHNGRIVKSFPTFSVTFPDKLYMYLDADSGSLMFASDTVYYGCAIGGINSGGAPLHPMLSATRKGDILTIVYRGKGEWNAPLNQSAPPPGPPSGLPAHLTPAVQPVPQTTVVTQSTHAPVQCHAGAPAQDLYATQPVPVQEVSAQTQVPVDDPSTRKSNAAQETSITEDPSAPANLPSQDPTAS